MALQPVDVVPDLAHRGRGHVSAVVRVRNHDHHDVLRVMARRERGEYRGDRAVEYFGRARLAGHAHGAQREPAERARGRALGHHAGQRVPDVGQGARGDRQVPDHRRVDPLHDRAAGADERLADPWAVQRAPVGQGRVRVGQLQRGDRDVALADGGNGRLAGFPHVAVAAVLVFDPLHVGAVRLAVLAPVLASVGILLPEVVQPFAGRHAAVALLRQVDPRGLAEPPGQLHFLHFLDGGLRAGDDVVIRVVGQVYVVGELVEYRVAGDDEGLVQADRAEARLAVIGERPVSYTHLRAHETRHD